MVGLATLALFFAVEWLGGSSGIMQSVLRVLIIPMYVVWLVFAMVQTVVLGPEPTAIAPLLHLVSLGAGLLPYALLDHAWRRWRSCS